MFTLDATTASLEVVLAGAITTNQLPIVSCFADKTTTAFTPGKTTTQTNSTSTVTIVAAPAASTQREVHSINVYNADTVAATITVSGNDNATLRPLVKTTLAVGDTLQYIHNSGWRVMDTNGQTKNTGAITTVNSPAGASGDVQYNNGSGGFGAESLLNYDATNDQLLVPGLTISQDAALTGDISPSQITANQNDYNPTNLATASVLRLNTDASRDITGLQGGADGRIIFIHNIGAQNIVLKDESASSSAANRFALTADLTMTPDMAVLLQYDSTSTRWRTIGGGSAVTPGGASGDIQYNSGAGGFAAEAAFNYNAATNLLIVDKITMNGLLDISSAASGQISFPATQNPSAGANVLDDYEEGTWTPSDQSGAALSLTNVVGNYIKIGRRVQALAQFTYPVTANAAVSTIGNLPYALISNANANVGVLCYTTLATATYSVGKAASGVTIGIYSNVTTNLTNAQVSGSIFSTDTGYLTD